VLRHFGVIVPPFRSSQLWEDEEHTQVVKVKELEPLDLLLVNDTNNSWGAHVAVYLGDDMVIHLSKKNGGPSICPLNELRLEPKYKVFIGAKRIKTPNKADAGDA
jgi:cell wall-associated NlpC family hydrolase